ncbi:MAG: hypothetical protein ACP5KW_04330 [Thermoproteota archaeon]
MEVAKKLDELEREIQKLKNLILFREDSLYEKKLVSLRGSGKLLVSEEELEDAITKAKKSMFSGIKDALRS